MNVISRCKVYSLDAFTCPRQHSCSINGQSANRIHIVQDTLGGNATTHEVVDRVRGECGGNGLVLNISSMPWRTLDSAVFHQANVSMLQFSSVVQFLSQLVSDPETALSRCAAQAADPAQPLTWLLLDNLSHLAMDPAFDAQILNKLLRSVQGTFGAVVISTSLPLAFHGGVENSFSHSGKCASGDRLLAHFQECDVVL